MILIYVAEDVRSLGLDRGSSAKRNIVEQGVIVPLSFDELLLLYLHIFQCFWLKMFCPISQQEI
jgi:hypothetical protein